MWRDFEKFFLIAIDFNRSFITLKEKSFGKKKF